jgi:hypothetical protein
MTDNKPKRGNPTDRRGRPPTRRITLTEEIAKRLYKHLPNKDDATVMVNLIVHDWLEAKEKV